MKNVNVCILIIAILFLITTSFAQQNHVDEILWKLSQTQNAVVKKIDIELTFKQPIDHDNPEKGFFDQRVFVIHKDYDKPVVLWLEGYALHRRSEQEITQILDANQIIVEHRYFGESKPDSLDWQYLTIEQAAADYHEVVKVFKKIYKGSWVNSGISKGGQTTMYHRRFYPADVDASVCYVAPLNFSDQEPRVYEFLENVGTAECRNKIKTFQKTVLKNKEKLLPKFIEYSNEKNYQFEIGAETAFEFCALEYSFAFWQWHNDLCDQIPADTASIQTIFDHFIKVASPYYFSDSGLKTYAPFFYQALTQIGYYAYDTEPFKEWITAVSEPNFNFCAPQGTTPLFDPSAMQNINDWIVDKGNNMLFIYGEQDPWSASAVELGGRTNGLLMIKEGGNHATRIKDFPDDQKKTIYNALENWLGIKLSDE